MANLLDKFEQDALRRDFDRILGRVQQAGGESIQEAKTLVIVRRVDDLGTVDPVTGRYNNPSLSVIYTGPAHISPVTFRRDRQEIAGQEAVRIRQYRMVLPWDSGDIHLDDVTSINFSSDPQMVNR